VFRRPPRLSTYGSRTDVSVVYKIDYKDSREQRVAADSYKIENGFVTFDLDDKPVLSVAADLVAEVHDDGRVNDPE
jgi:hypothetical protein